MLCVGHRDFLQFVNPRPLTLAHHIDCRFAGSIAVGVGRKHRLV